MNSKKQASKIKCARRGSADQANRIREKLWNEKRNKKITLFQLISSYVIWLKNICLRVKAPSVTKRLLKKLHSSLLH